MIDMLIATPAKKKPGSYRPQTTRAADIANRGAPQMPTETGHASNNNADLGTHRQLGC
jgi:hypothetical protein